MRELYEKKSLTPSRFTNKFISSVLEIFIRIILNVQSCILYSIKYIIASTRHTEIFAFTALLTSQPAFTCSKLVFLLLTFSI